ncbi:MAG: phosphohydrolase [Verrucomicrobia bacterium RIFCSPLOWO2_12_FULL_64_8]|nr:MAG: phosphohydrolase [Verrucomicrobia bacterium RIFCSPLOWO2_12_FULL_64_8]
MPDSVLMTVRELKALEHPAGSQSGRAFSATLLVRKVTARTAKNDSTFLSVELGDRTGSFSFICFSDSPYFDFFKRQAEGAVLRVEGKTDYYQDRFSPRITRADELTPDQLAAPGVMENLVEVPPEDPARLWEELQNFVAAIGHAELRVTVQAVFDALGEAFKTSPAAVAMHHAYRHGLLEHTVHMAKAAKALLPLYPEVDADLALAGVLLHDVGKTIEYEGALAPRKSRKGILQGHVVLGYQLVRKAGLKAKLDPDRLERIEHIILSHQGEIEYGAAVMAATPEAVFVSMIDNLDAKMGMVQRALRQAAGGEEFSEKLPGLNAPLLIKKPGD